MSNSRDQDATDEKKEVKKYEFEENGPPPDMRQRELIFDSLQKIVYVNLGTKRRVGGQAQHVDNRGTYVFTWGAGYHSQLGRKFERGKKKYSAIPLPVEMDDICVIRQVCCGGLHTAVVTETGRVYTWGDGKKGELGHQHDPSSKQTPRMVENLDNVFISYVACGGSHTVAISDNGTMYSWGFSKFGQIGHGDRSQVVIPRKVEHPDVHGIVQVACGHRHTIALKSTGEVLSFGHGKHYQTGHGTDDDWLVPHKVEALEGVNISYVACGAIHTCFVSDDGKLYLCGFGEYFHPDESRHFFHVPTLIDVPEPVSQIACGQSHNIALCLSGNVYGWGSGEYGQIGYGMEGNLSVPRLVLDNKNVAAVSAGRYHSFALTNAGVLYSWGCGENGQLGQNSDENLSLPTIVTTILGTVVGQVSCGEHHTAVLTSAPWSRLSQDVAEWHHSAKVEHELKNNYLTKTHRGLTRKDLAKLREDMKAWTKMNEHKREEQKQEEEVKRAEDIAAIHSRKQLTQDITSKMKDSEGNERLMLPVVDDVDDDKSRAGQTTLPRIAGAQPISKRDSMRGSVRRPGRERDTQSKTLPLVNAKSSSRHQLSKTGGQNSSQTQLMATRQRDSKDRSISAQVPLSRTAFLKETAQMVKRMTAVVQDKGEVHNNKQLKKMSRELFACRKEFDTLRNISRKKMKIVNDLKRETKIMDKSHKLSSSSHTDYEALLHSLKMQFNTVTIKIAEAGENKKNYDDSVAHLKEEDFEHFNQLKLLRKKNNDNNNIFKKMNELKAQSVEEQEKAESELNEFRHEIQAYQKFVKRQLQQFENILEIVRSQNEKREKAKFVRTEKQRARIASRIEKLNAEALAAEKEASALTARLTQLDLKLRHFEDSFQKITAATGLTNPDAIVNKFSFKGEIKDQLQREIDDKVMVIEQLRADEAKLKKQLQQAKDSYREETWRDVEKVTESHREVDFKANKTKQEVERSIERTAFVQEGLLNLLRMVEAVDTDDNQPSDPIVFTEESTLWQQTEVEHVLSRISIQLEFLVTKAAEWERVLEAERLAREEEERKAAENQPAVLFGGVDVKAMIKAGKQYKAEQEAAEEEEARKAAAAQREKERQAKEVAENNSEPTTYNIGSNRDIKTDDGPPKINSAHTDPKTLDLDKELTLMGTNDMNNDASNDAPGMNVEDDTYDDMEF